MSGYNQSGGGCGSRSGGSGGASMRFDTSCWPHGIVTTDNPEAAMRLAEGRVVGHRSPAAVEKFIDSIPGLREHAETWWKWSSNCDWYCVRDLRTLTAKEIAFRAAAEASA